MNTLLKKMSGILVILSFIVPAKAQILTGGIMAGVSTGTVKIENMGSNFSGVLEGKNIMGYEAGVFLKLNLLRFYIKPMALYEYRYGEVNYSQTQSSGNTSVHTDNFHLYKAEVPVLLGLRILGPLSIEGGPVYNYILKSTDTFSNEQVSVANSGLGYRVGLSAKLCMLLLNVSYQGITYTPSGTNTTTFKEPSKIIFGLGLQFGGRKPEKKRE